MSVTLRYDLGWQASTCLLGAGGDLCAALGFRATARHSSGGRDPHECYTFAIRLPGQLGEAMKLLAYLSAEARGPWRPSVIINSFGTLRGKLAVALGIQNSLLMPWTQWTSLGVLAIEQSFFWAILDAPADLLHWYAYRDWLLESACEDRRRRGRIITAWSSGKRAKARYGKIILGDE